MPDDRDWPVTKIRPYGLREKVVLRLSGICDVKTEPEDNQ